MKITQATNLVDKGQFLQTDEYKIIESNINEAIRAIEHPIGSGGFFLFEKKQGNGVKPIKEAFIEKLNQLGWKDEKIADPFIKGRRIDSTLKLNNGKYFGVEWETGNISSSHRALNRLALGIMEGVLEGGILVLPSREMYYYLTDRIGNFQELKPYFKIWSSLNFTEGMLQEIEIEHDGVSDTIPPIAKGTDGRALI